MALADNIRFLRKQHGLSQDELAARLGYKSFTTIQKWESGVSEPPLKQIAKMAKLFNINMQDLVDCTLPQQTSPKKGFKIPVLGQVAAGVPIEAIEDVIDYEEIPVEWTKTGEYFGLKIKGDSMSPRILDGDVVIVRKQSTCDSSDIAVILVDGEDATVKKIQISNGGIMLIPLNPAYDPKFFDRQTVLNLPVTIIGKVVELRGKF